MSEALKADPFLDFGNSKRTPGLKAIIWDVDGTLIDSRASIFRAAVEAAIAINIDPPTYDQVRSIVGLSLFNALAMMRPDLDHERIAAYTYEFQQAYLRFHADPEFHDALYPRADETLRAVKAEGWLMGMATGQSRRGVNRNIAAYGWEDIFDCAFCADDGPSKPHPHMLERNLETLAVCPQDAIMIGDTAHDIHMGREAGVRTIGVSWGFHTVEELQAAGAGQIVHDFMELKAALAVVPAHATA